MIMKKNELVFEETMDKMKEECGLFGIYGNDNVTNSAELTYYALFALQHRGQESCGIAVNDEGTITYHKNLGLVPDVFNESIISRLNGQIAVGHVRYSANGGNLRENVQPLVMKYVKGTLTVAHNGNLVNAASLRDELEQHGAVFQGTNDAEIISNLIARERMNTASVEEAVVNMTKKLQGAYCLIIMSPSKLIAVRDPNGFRPLSLGKLNGSYIVASETVAFDAIGAEFVRDVEPGEVLVITKDGLQSILPEKKCPSSLCIFEHIYFARPDSVLEGASVFMARKCAGRFLAQEHPVEADVVIAVPDSGIGAAIGYAEGSGIPYDIGLMKNRYIARTFIQPTQAMRENAVRIKLNALSSVVKGKRVVMVDDSIVRGTTCRRIIQLLRDAGATEVHMRVSSPPFLYPCYFGTDIPSQNSLVAVGRTVEEIRDIIGVDSLGYLSVENMMKIAEESRCGFCNACFTGKYPIPVEEAQKYNESKSSQRKFIKILGEE